MSLPSDTPLHKLQFYVTTGYTCGYLPNRMAQSLIAAPQHLVDANVYSGLIQQGFRRSGKFSYRPHCENCQECVPVRVVLEKFSPNRSQKRAFKQHQNLITTILPVGYHEEHYALYASYQRARHSDDKTADQMETDSDSQENDVEQYQSFLCQSNVESVLVEFREGEQLKMVSVIDIVRDGISAVYTFYDTSDSTSSYGTYNVLWQSLWAQTLGLPYLYLGYWIKDSRKMAYKQNYKPLEKLIDGEWR
ncbi:arginyltransferase [Methylotenera sp.]|uniref:arginyltransferase n=1 Tax=Methylotenera sp. TaxID=2051956 RepID=UPI002ED9B834